MIVVLTSEHLITSDCRGCDNSCSEGALVMLMTTRLLLHSRCTVTAKAADVDDRLVAF